MQWNTCGRQATGCGGEGSAEALAWVEGRKAELWEGKVEEVLDALALQQSNPKAKQPKMKSTTLRPIGSGCAIRSFVARAIL